MYNKLYKVPGDEPMKKIELLSPAGSMESLIAAVQSGADAVYLGGTMFSARAYASNFDNDNMIKACDYCHLYGVKIYVTMNTIVKEGEMAEAITYAEFLYSIGIDALIIQDVGLFKRIREYLPEFELHASTQMTVHNGEGALFLKSLGFKRIVLSRELSLREIEHISKDLGVETEIFVHGALCICYSGQCLMSSMIGGRSGNRGRCAQPCRLPYTIYNKLDGKRAEGYLLSPKDICTLKDIEEIIESGTSSLKIEGRMKRPEYVAGVVSAYRKVIDGLYSCEDSVTTEEYKKLLQLFNREGFSKAYLFGNVGRDMMAVNFPKNTGVELGTAEKDGSLILKEGISLKDGVRSLQNGFTVSKITLNGKEVKEASKGQKVKLFPEKYETGAMLFKTADSILNAELERVYRNPFGRKVKLPLYISFKAGEVLTLRTMYNGVEFKEYGSMVERPVNKPLTKEKIEENLGKSGDTPIRFDKISFDIFEDGYIAVSSLNAARRELTRKIEGHIISKYKRTPNVAKDYKKKVKEQHNIIPQAIACVTNGEQLKGVIESGIAAAFKVSMLGKSIDMNTIKGKGLYIKVPNIIKEEFESVCSDIEDVLPYVNGIVTGNLGIIKRFTGRTSIIGDYKLNIFNRYAVDFYSRFLDGMCLSVELNRGEVADILKNINIPVQVMVYGRIELMVSEYCAIGSTFGGKCSKKGCSGSCKNGDYYIKDRMGVDFPITVDKYCRSHIYNSVPLNLLSNLSDLKGINANWFRFDFTDESYEETVKVLESFKGGSWDYEYEGYTRGHYKRGVE
jgi:U32 family peptidase